LFSHHDIKHRRPHLNLSQNLLVHLKNDKRDPQLFWPDPKRAQVTVLVAGRCAFSGGQGGVKGDLPNVGNGQTGQNGG
jgi:hypothetical protein